MRDDYLWDGCGEPDPEIQKLETVLGRLRHNRPAPAFPEIAPVRRHFWQFGAFQFAAGAAAGILVIAAVTFMLHSVNPNPSSRPGWEVTRVAGTPRVGTEALGAARE